MNERNAPCWCGSGRKWKQCHYPHGRAADSTQVWTPAQYRKQGIVIKTPEQIQGIRAAGHLAAKILDTLCAVAKEGVTTAELDDLANQLHKEAGAIPAPLGYGTPPFPKSICTSINEVICHGIPSNRKLKLGDIVNIDVTAKLHGYYGDCSRMVAIGQVDPEKQLVMDVALESLLRAESILKPGVLVSKIGEIIESYANAKGCSAVHQFVGHGVGVMFHEGPQIPHFRNKMDIPLVEGMTFTIEPMINAGVAEGIIDPKNQWEATTADGKPSAQWEHTLLITATGYENLTPWTL